jgi:hypothetical protein
MSMFPLNSVARSDVEYDCEQCARKFGQQEISVDAMLPLFQSLL